MRRAGALAAVVLAALLAVLSAAAGAQGTSTAIVLFGGIGPGRVLSEQTVPVRPAGQLVVSFHGDAASGCAARGLCGYSGTVVFRPGATAVLAIEAVRAGRGRAYQVALVFENALTGSEVSRGSGGGQAGRCADEDQPNAELSPGVQGGVVSFDVLEAGGALLATRCAGPLDGDLAAAGPSISVPLSQLQKGNTALDLSATRSFAADGLAGTVASTLRLSVGKAPRPKSPFTVGKLPSRIKLKPQRFVTERLKVTGVSGALTGAVGATNTPGVCGLLDACGFSGSFTLAPSAQAASASLLAVGSAKIGYRSFLAALHGRRIPGIHVQGTLDWAPGGTLSTSLTGPGETCTDTAPVPLTFAVLIATASRLTADYSSVAGLRTRCPGPLAGNAPLASGATSLKVLRQRAFALTLRGAGASSDDGYNTDLRGALRITLSRGAITQQVFRVPSP